MARSPHRPPHRLRRGHVGGVPPVRHHPGRRARRAAGHRRDARPGRAPPTGDGVCVYAISGGTGAHMADLAAAAGLRLPDLTDDDARRRCTSGSPTYLRVSNPVDNGGAPSADWRGRKILDAIVADPNVDVVICPITGALPSMRKPLARDLVAVAETTDKPICVIWGSPVDRRRRRTRDPAVVVEGRHVPHVRQLRAARCGRGSTGTRSAARYRSPFAKPVPRPAARRRRPAAPAAAR